jgi:hypothetical protein
MGSGAASGISTQTLGRTGDPRPPEGQRAVGPFNFSAVDAVPIVTNLTGQMATHNLISFAQAIYVDNAANAGPAFIVFGIQKITVPANTQGWFPVISQRPIIFSVAFPVGGGACSVIVTNYPVSPFLWKTV